MKYKKLGKTSISIPSIGQGTMGIGGFFSKDTSNDAECIRLIRSSIDLGMNLIDTAEVYGGGHAEELIGKAVEGIRDQVIIATKFSPENSGYHDVITSAEKSLQRLKTDWIDLYQVHWPNPDVPAFETIRALTELREQGKIRAAGVSNYSFGQLLDVVKYSGNIVSNQVEYNLFDRSIESGLIQYCDENDVTIIAYSPLDQGHISPGGEKASVLTRIAEKYMKTSSQVVLNWLISHRNVVAIPKSNDPIHIRQNAEAADFKLVRPDIEEMNRVFHTKPLEVPTKTIKVVLDGQGSRKAYQTIDEALKNTLGFTPSPSTLAQDIARRGEAVKPVRVRKSQDRSGRYDYDLVEGRIRYWAWVIAYQGKKPIPVLVR